MIFTHWKPTLLVTLLALGLVGCGNGDEQATDTETSQSQEETAAAQAPTVAEPTDAPIEGPVEEEPEEAPVIEEMAPADQDASELAPANTEVSADTETLGESPETALGEEEALPGEATREDVDAIIEETERRFQEAQQRIDEQFEQAGQEAAVPEPMQDDEFESHIDSSLDIDSSLESAPLVDEGSERLDVDAIIEEQERRFEEAQQELEQQFEEMEREVPEPDGFDGGATQSEAAASDTESTLE